MATSVDDFNPHRRLPWSILIPLKFFFLFSGIPPSDLYLAGLFMPISVTIGLMCLGVYDSAFLGAVGSGDLNGTQLQGGDQV